MKSRTRIVFTQGGKGGVAKTELAVSLVSWYSLRGMKPALLDFDVENTTKSGLQNFYPEARKFDVHEDGALDEFFNVAHDSEVVLADLGSGAGLATYRWFNAAYEDAVEWNLAFTAVGVTTNDAGAVKSVLAWAEQLQNRVHYLIVLNEMREIDSAFEYWYQSPDTARFTEAFEPKIMRMMARVQEFQSELRNQSATLQAVLDGTVDCPFLRMMKNIMRARRYQRALFVGFDSAESILLP